MWPLRVEAEPPMGMQGVQLLACQPCCLHIFAVSCSCKQVWSTDGVAWSQPRYPQWTWYGFVEHPSILTRGLGINLQSLQERSLFALPNWMRRPRLHLEDSISFVFYCSSKHSLSFEVTSTNSGVSLWDQDLQKFGPKNPRISDLCVWRQNNLWECSGVQLLACQPCCLHIFAICSCKQASNSQSGAQLATVAWFRFDYSSSKHSPLIRSYIDELRGRDLLSIGKQLKDSCWTPLELLCWLLIHEHLPKPPVGCRTNTLEPKHMLLLAVVTQRWVWFSWRSCLVTAWYPQRMDTSSVLLGTLDTWLEDQSQKLAREIAFLRCHIVSCRFRFDSCGF